MFASQSMSGGGWWRQARQGHNLTTSDVARALGVSQRYVQSIEAGIRLPSARLQVEATRLFALDPSHWLTAHLAGESRCHSLLELAEQLINADWLPEAGVVLGRVVAMARQSYRGRYTGELCRLAGIMRFKQGRARQACLWFARMERAYQRQGSPERRLRGAFNHALALAGVGRYHAALDRLDRAERLCRRLPKDRAMVHYARGHLLSRLRSYQEAVSEYRKAGHLLGWQGAGFESRLGEMVATWAWKGPQAALPMAKRLLERAADVAQRQRSRHNLAVLHRQLGDVKTSVALLKESMAETWCDGQAALAGTVAEMLLCQVLLPGGEPVDQTLEQFRSLLAVADGEDLAAVRVICLSRGWEVPVSPINSPLHEGYEGRLGAALHWASDAMQAQTAAVGAYQTDPGIPEIGRDSANRI
ncbi:MAG: helix-turn-helix domain-containing protein [Sulfobacillus sp.]